MAINWNFDKNNVQEEFELLPEGDYRVRIASVEEAVSSGGNDMLKIKLDVSGYPNKLFYYLVFMPNNTAFTNTSLKRVYDSFAIPEGNMDFTSWEGRVGACKVKHREYDGRQTANVQYFIMRDKQDALPPWQEKAGTTPFNSTAPFTDGDLPF